MKRLLTELTTHNSKQTGFGISKQVTKLTWSKRNGWGAQEETYMTKDDTQKQANPIEKWIANVGQKFSRSKNIFSEMRVVTLENNRTVHPEGKQLEKENEESCGEEEIISRSK